MNKNHIAQRCANRLFKNGNGDVAQRLMLVGADGRDLGGWGIGPLMDIIADEIEAERTRERKARRKKVALKEDNAKS